MSTSQAALDSIDITRLEGMVAGAIQRAGAKGLTSDEIRAQFPSFAYSSITARFAALARRGFISRNGDTRPSISGRSQLVMRSNIWPQDADE